MKASNIVSIVKNNLIKYRKQNFLSQKDLAQRMKVTQRVIAYYENEATNIPIDQLQKFAKVFKVSISELINEKLESIEKIEEVDIRLIRKIHQIDALPRRAKESLWFIINTTLEYNNLGNNSLSKQKG